MRLLRLSSTAALALMISTAAHADQESDRLREALRSATAQARAAEDQRAAVQAKLTAAEQERDRLRKQNEAYRAQVKEAEQAYRQAVKDFNERIAERDDSLEKWKSAYGEAANVARTKDAERTKFEGEATTWKASAKACEAKNVKLAKIADDVVKQYENMDPLEKVLDHDPVFGLKRVEHQNAAQDFRDKIIEQKAKP
jgi:chromosome segregation ATPase